MNKQHIFIRSKYILIVIGLLVTKISAAQTFVTAPMTGTPAAGEYYNNSGITISPDFSFTAGPGQSLHLYTVSADCAPLATNLSLNQNYILTSIPRIAGMTSASMLLNRSTCDLMQTVQYVDGLGRPVQTVQVKGSPTLNDIVQPIVYDAFGREAIKYMPYTSAINDGSFKVNALTSQVAFYTTPPAGVTPFSSPASVSVFDNSPLNRVIEQGAPGAPWQPTGDTNTPGHTLKMDYVANDQVTAFSSTPGSTNLGSRIVAQYTATANDDQSRTLARINNNASYAAGQLYITISKDENWTPAKGCVGTTEEYKDVEGHVVLKRTYNLNAAATAVIMSSTYYVYDEAGNLAFVLPPGANPDDNAAISQTTLDNLCYQYNYDERSRLTQKKVPGKGWEFMVYNKLDQVVATQDAVQRGKSTQEWSFTKYDALARVACSGIYQYPGSTPGASYRTALQSTVDAQASLWETATTTGSGYTSNAWPTSSTTNLIVNYYDNYTYPGNPYNPTVSGTLTNPTGLLTAAKTAVLLPDGTYGSMLWTVHYYDDKGRVAQTFQQHYLGGESNLSTDNRDVVTTTYNFDNQAAAIYRYHYTKANPNVEALRMDNAYFYDHMGRKTKTYTAINNAPSILLSKEEYNEIGQLKAKHLHSTNDGSSFLQDISYAYNERGWLKTSSAPLFAMQLNYNDGTTPQYNGNIANQYWGTPGNLSKNYTYSYDALNRLIDGSGNTGYNETGISYDNMGNMLSLVRSGGANSVSLNYDSYTGNQLTSVKNSGSQFRTYGYDNNGNATSDGQGHTIIYNMLNLPASIPDKSITYTYDATGNKLRRVVSGTATEYISGIQYTGSTIDFVQTEEGRVLNPGGTPNYEYTLADHLGNSRVNFDSSHGGSTTIQTDDYYPFGMDINSNASGIKNEYLYNKKELQEELVQYDYGARFYDPVIGRWTSVDPLAEKHFSLSAYNYTANNPVNNIDPDGRDYIAGGGQYGGDLYTGADAQNLFRNLQGNGDGGKDKGKKKDDKPKEEQKSTWNFGAFKTAGISSLALVGDDVTGVGVADDVAIPFIYTGAAAVFLYQNKDVIAKMTQELDRILDKAAGPQGVQYALLTASDGLYNVYTSGSAAPTGKVWLAKGSVWKYGETTSNERYNPGYLAKEGVVFVPQVPGNQVQIKVAEKLQIYTYFLTHGTLPAGNKIFR